MKNYNKIFKIGMWGLIAVSTIILILGFILGWEEFDGFQKQGTIWSSIILDWAYVMVAIALIAVLGVGLVIAIKSNPKTLKKLGIGAAAVAVLVAIAFLLASGKPAIGLTGAVEPTDGELKLTDTVLNLTYITAIGAIAAILFSEIYSKVKTDKKK